MSFRGLLPGFFGWSTAHGRGLARRLVDRPPGHARGLLSAGVVVGRSFVFEPAGSLAPCPGGPGARFVRPSSAIVSADRRRQEFGRVVARAVASFAPAS